MGRKFYVLRDITHQGIMQNGVFKYMVENPPDWFRGMVFKVGVDVQRKKTTNPNTAKYAIDGEKLIDFLEAHKPVPYFAKLLGMAANTLRVWIEEGKIKGLTAYPYGKTTMLYNVDDLLNRIKEQEIAIPSEKVHRPDDLLSLYDNYLPNEILSTIHEYIRHRLSKTPGISIGGVSLVKKGFIKEENAEAHRRALKNLFFDIITSIEGIQFDGDTKLKFFWGHDVEILELEKVSNTEFSLDDFDEECVSLLSEKYSDITLQKHLLNVLKPFYCFYLMKKEKVLKKEKRKNKTSFEERYRMQEDFEDIKTAILDVFNNVVIFEPAPDEKKKSYLTREQYAKLYARVEEKYGIYKLVPLELGFRLGLRAKETTLVAVEDFWIDENGFLKTDENGFGWLFLPAAKCKGGKNGGAEERGKLIPPATVKLINEYLEELYKKCPFETHKQDAGRTFTTIFGKKVYETGHGFLIRDSRFPERFDKPTTKQTVQKFIRETRGECGFLTSNQKKYLHYHDGRHSLNEWIETAIVEPKLSKFTDFVADFQVHHSSSGDIGKSNYRNKDIIDTYTAIINISINFPLELPALREWEIKHLYREKYEKMIKIDENTSIMIETDKIKINDVYKKSPDALKPRLSPEEEKHLAARYKELQDLLNSTTQPPSEGNAMEWATKRMHWLDELEKIKEHLA